eukprot:COSAG02_NODE_9217_length_2285_cov_2.476670_5_plen_110_part_00
MDLQSIRVQYTVAWWVRGAPGREVAGGERGGGVGGQGQVAWAESGGVGEKRGGVWIESSTVHVGDVAASPHCGVRKVCCCWRRRWWRAVKERRRRRMTSRMSRQSPSTS